MKFKRFITKVSDENIIFDGGFEIKITKEKRFLPFSVVAMCLKTYINYCKNQIDCAEKLLSNHALEYSDRRESNETGN